MTVNLDEFVKEQGYRVIPTEEKKISLDEIRFNLFAYLEDYPKMNYSFVKTEKELLELRKGSERYRLFGQSFLGYFVIGEKNHIFLMTNSEGVEVFRESLVLVNSSLKTFVSSYSLFLSAVFILKSKFYEIEAREVEEIAANFMKQVADLEENVAQELTFWEHMAYLIEDDGIVLRDDFFPILNEGQ